MKITEDMINITTLTTLLLIAYSFSKTHIMNNLIMIEFIIISLLSMMFITLMTLKMENHLVMYFITTAICESMMGLSMMIAMIRTHSNDYLKSTNILKY